MAEASSHTVHLTGRLRDLETLLSEHQSQEKKFLKDLEENKKRYREAKQENLQLHGKRHTNCFFWCAVGRKCIQEYISVSLPLYFGMNHFIELLSLWFQTSCSSSWRRAVCRGRRLSASSRSSSCFAEIFSWQVQYTVYITNLQLALLINSHV